MNILPWTFAVKHVKIYARPLPREYAIFLFAIEYSMANRKIAYSLGRGWAYISDMSSTSGYMGEQYFQEFGPRFFDMSSASGYMGKIAWNGMKWCREAIFPTNLDLADILGDMDFDFENVHCLIPHFWIPNSQISKSPDLRISRFQISRRRPGLRRRRWTNSQIPTPSAPRDQIRCKEPLLR